MQQDIFKKTFIFILGLLIVAPNYGYSSEPAVIAVIIDDIGHNLAAGQRVVNSKLPITCSILPARPHSIHLARLAHQNGKEVMLHLPMQASKSERLGHGGLTTAMSKQEFIRIVDISIDAVPHAQGINNHMGSLLTTHSDHMEWLMQTIANREEDLFFVDSKTTVHTVAADTAANYHIPSLRRDVFLDSIAHDQTFVRQQIQTLISTAKKQGYALAIGHPHKTTLSVLEQELSKLNKEDVELVTVNQLIQIAKDKQWQKYTSLAY